MLSLVQAIMAAEAGVKAKVESTAAAIEILISNLAWKGNQRIAGYRDTHFPPETFPEEDILCAAMQREARRTDAPRVCAMRPIARSTAAN
jgi:hypothetical protein